MPLGVGNGLYGVEFIELLDGSESKSPLVDFLALFAEFRAVEASFGGFTCFGLLPFWVIERAAIPVRDVESITISSSSELASNSCRRS